MLNEFRQDLVSGEWVLFATGRASRPDLVKSKEVEITPTPKDKCPFEDPEKYGNEVVATYWNDDRSDWSMKVSKNKYPAVLDGEAGPRDTSGPFSVQEAKGKHEIIIFRGHDRYLKDFSKDELAKVLEVYQERYLATLDHGLRKYTLIFHNHGPSAGASIQHPHSQIMSIPVLPPDVRRSIDGSQAFYRKHKKRIYDVMINWEKEQNKRIIFENDNFLAFCPFVSKTPYEIRIFPKESHAHFEKMPKDQLPYLGEAVGTVLRRVHEALDNPDFNFFIHTAPLEDDEMKPHEFYTWHIEVVPKISKIGAFELGSGIDVNVVDPDGAAELLR